MVERECQPQMGRWEADDDFPPQTPFSPNSAAAGQKSYFGGMKGSMLHAETPFCFDPDAGAPQTTLFYPDSFSGEYFGSAWHGKRKLWFSKKAKGRMSDTWILFDNSAHEDQSILRTFLVWFWI